jgi:hypothetical protein
MLRQIAKFLRCPPALGRVPEQLPIFNGTVCGGGRHPKIWNFHGMETFSPRFPRHGKRYPRCGKIFPQRGSSGFLGLSPAVASDVDVFRGVDLWSALPQARSGATCHAWRYRARALECVGHRPDGPGAAPSEDYNGAVPSSIMFPFTSIKVFKKRLSKAFRAFVSALASPDAFKRARWFSRNAEMIGLRGPLRISSPVFLRARSRSISWRREESVTVASTSFWNSRLDFLLDCTIHMRAL